MKFKLNVNKIRGIRILNNDNNNNMIVRDVRNNNILSRFNHNLIRTTLPKQNLYILDSIKFVLFKTKKKTIIFTDILMQHINK